jgi:hypothetical protein
MTVDESEFFRQSTLHICDNLDIERAVVQFLRYFKKLVPVDQLILERYDEGLRSISSIVIATPGGGESVDVPAPFSDESQDILNSFLTKRRYPRAITPMAVYKIVTIQIESHFPINNSERPKATPAASIITPQITLSVQA